MTDADTIRVELNGESRSLSSGLTVARLVEQLGRDSRTVAIEYNGHILARSEYSTTEIVEGDCLEVVHFVQGG